MDPLFEFYARSYPIGWVRKFQAYVQAPFDLEANMVLQAVLTTICVAGLAFYVRFLVALCKDYKVHFLVRLREEQNIYLMPEPEEAELDTSVAA